MDVKHRWTLADDKTCCEKVIECYVLGGGTMGVTSFIHHLNTFLPDISSGSLRYKVQNIKQLLLELGVENSLPIAPYANYSKQNKTALMMVLKENGIMRDM